MTSEGFIIEWLTAPATSRNHFNSYIYNKGVISCWGYDYPVFPIARRIGGDSSSTILLTTRKCNAQTTRHTNLVRKTARAKLYGCLEVPYVRAATKAEHEVNCLWLELLDIGSVHAYSHLVSMEQKEKERELSLRSKRAVRVRTM